MNYEAIFLTIYVKYAKVEIEYLPSTKNRLWFTY